MRPSQHFQVPPFDNLTSYLTCQEPIPTLEHLSSSIQTFSPPPLYNDSNQRITTQNKRLPPHEFSYDLSKKIQVTQSLFTKKISQPEEFLGKLPFSLQVIENDQKESRPKFFNEPLYGLQTLQGKLHHGLSVDHSKAESRFLLESDLRYNENVQQQKAAQHYWLKHMAQPRFEDQIQEKLLSQNYERQQNQPNLPVSFNRGFFEPRDLTSFDFHAQRFGVMPLQQSLDPFHFGAKLKSEIILKQEPIKIEQEYEDTFSPPTPEEDSPSLPFNDFDSIKSAQKSAKKDKLNGKVAEVSKQKTQRRSNPTDNFSIAAEIMKKEKAEPRAKNKWQLKEEQTAKEQKSILETAQEILPKTRSRRGSSTNFGISSISLPIYNAIIKDGTEGLNPAGSDPNQEVIPTLENTSLDYDYLLSITFSKVPEQPGDSNVSQASFVVSSQYENYVDSTNRGHLKPKAIQKGEDYQAEIPTLQSRDSGELGTEKWPELVWNPLVLTQREIDMYFMDLKKIFKCENINQERSLNLLKKKNYRRDKVVTNIGKNEKFYAGFLVVNNKSYIGETTEQSK